MAARPSTQQFALGIDLGSNSVGWAIVALIDDEPAALLRCGVRVFPAGMVNEKGTEKSRNMDRRLARLQRRQIWRRARRLRKIFNLLQRFGLLPTDCVRSPEERQKFLNGFDQEILASRWFKSKAESGRYPEPEQVMPYILRAAALDEEIPIHFLGRALYHLAQRRGFLSNAKRSRATRVDSEQKGGAEQESRNFRERLGGRTLGQYFASLPPSQDKVRGPWAAGELLREMYQTEFERIWDAQSRHYPDVLIEKHKGSLYLAIFDQRGPKKRPGLIGHCEFATTERRAPSYLLISQRFRMLQAVNNLRVWRRGTGEQRRCLSGDERARLIDLLEREGDVEFKRVREIPGLDHYSFNLQKDREYARMPGDNTGSQFYRVFRDRWFTFDATQRERIVADAYSIHSLRDKREQRRRAAKYLETRCIQNLDEATEEFLAIRFEDGRMGLSVKAMTRFLPLLERGFRFGDIQGHYASLEEVTPRLLELAESGVGPEEACNQVLSKSPRKYGKSLDLLPPILQEDVQRFLGQIRNPIVLRSLTELRKVVNAIVRRYGKPAVVRIELARELKKSKEERERIWRENNARERSNAQMIEEIRRETGSYSPGDLTRYKLWQESKDGRCPYCLEAMSRPSLFLDGLLQVDHIIPRGQILDDSFTNLVLCHAECNQRKGNRTPFEAFSSTDKWEQILVRAKSFGDAKLWRFRMAGDDLKKFCEKFKSNQLNDTAYASRTAGDYLGLLFGGREDVPGMRVQVSSGGTTKFFREVWKLDGILNDGSTANGGKVFKTRDDHRHHAVDAAVIAVTEPGMVRRLNDAAKYAATHERFKREYMERYENGPLLGVTFRQVLRNEIDNIVVSHRVSRKVSGPLHRETHYSPQEFGPSVRRHRIPLKELNERQIQSETAIPDKGVRDLIRRKMESLGVIDPGKAFADERNLPCFVTRDGRTIPIKKVRIQETVKTRRIGQGCRIRYVKPGGPGGNHHVEIFGLPGPNGRDRRWDTPGVVTMLEAYDRVTKSQAVVRTVPEPGWEFRFSLAQDDTLSFDAGPFKGKYLVVKAISEEEKKGSVKIEMKGINDARQKSKIKGAQKGKEARQWVTKSPNELRKWGARRVIVSPLGEATIAND